MNEEVAVNNPEIPESPQPETTPELQPAEPETEVKEEVAVLEQEETPEPELTEPARPHWVDQRLWEVLTLKQKNQLVRGENWR